jgi:hypothetical protein
MRIRYALSRLSRAAARRAFGRTWAWVCGIGALLSVFVLGWQHLFFIAAVWFVCIFLPVRIAVEALHSRGPKIAGALRREIRGAPDRYATPEGVAVMVEALFADEVRMPRLAPPDLGPKVIEAAAQVARRALGGGGPTALQHAAGTCGALVEQWTRAIADGESPRPRGAAPADGGPERWTSGNGASPPAGAASGRRDSPSWDAGASIQDQWERLRALAGMAALAKTLAAVYEDSAGAAAEPDAVLRPLCEAAMDYVDQVGLALDGPPWDPALADSGVGLASDRADALRETWVAFCSAPPPAPRRLRAFVDALTG